MSNDSKPDIRAQEHPASASCGCYAPSEIPDYFDDYDCDDQDTCECCGGDGVVEYLDHPETWGEDCPSYQNHLVPCPECARRERNAK